MSSEAVPLVWNGQNFEGVAIPESGGDVSEEARLRTAPIGVYEMFLCQLPRYAFSGALLINGAKAQPTGCEEQRQFEVAETLDGIERTVMIQSAGGDLPFESLEIIPLDWAERPIDFTRLEVGARQSTIRFRQDAPQGSLKIRFSGINLLDVETVAACLWDHGRQVLPDPLAPSITRADEIRVDKLCNPTGKARKVEGHLLALFDLLLDKAPGRICSLQCSYQYPLAASVPVLLTTGTDFSDDAAISQLVERMGDWYLATEPAKGAFVFEVKLYGTNALRPLPALQLTRLLLPTESIADW